jgi:hypothetical protein
MGRNNKSGNSHQRRKTKKQLTSVLTEMGLGNQSKLPAPEGPVRWEQLSRREKFTDAFGLLSFACTVGSWGWSVIAPESSVFFGSVLLLIAVGSGLVAAYRIWHPRTLWAVAIALAVIVSFGTFDWFIVIQPQRGKPFKDLLVNGYHLSSECGSIPAKSQMPTWMRDQSKEWQARTEQLISQKLNYKYTQLWQGAIIVGLVKDENTVAYQCTWLANKVGALETIISENYDPELRHRDYKGPIYWFEAGPDGKVDISDAFKQRGNDAKMSTH